MFTDNEKGWGFGLVEDCRHLCDGGSDRMERRCLVTGRRSLTSGGDDTPTVYEEKRIDPGFRDTFGHKRRGYGKRRIQRVSR